MKQVATKIAITIATIFLSQNSLALSPDALDDFPNLRVICLKDQKYPKGFTEIIVVTHDPSRDHLMTIPGVKAFTYKRIVEKRNNLSLEDAVENIDAIIEKAQVNEAADTMISDFTRERNNREGMARLSTDGALEFAGDKGLLSDAFNFNLNLRTSNGSLVQNNGSGLYPCALVSRAPVAEVSSDALPVESDSEISPALQ